MRKQQPINFPEILCDGPLHEGDKQMQYDTITVSHGYGSPFDMENQDFCSLKCLFDWTLENKDNDL